MKSSTNDETLAQRFGCTIRQHRTARGLTLEQVAERAGVTPDYLGTLENGRRAPSLSSVIAVARGLGVAPSELLTFPDLSPASQEIAQVWDKVPPFPPDEPPTPVAPACRVPARFALPFFGLETRHQLAPWGPRRASRG